MLAIAGRTAGPNWITFFEETYEFLECNIDKKLNFFKFYFLNINIYKTGPSLILAFNRSSICRIFSS